MLRIEEANRKAIEGMFAGEPVLVDLIPAAEAIPQLKDRMILHAGPPVEWERMCGPMRGAIMGIAVFEGWADSLEVAEAKASAGEFEFHPNHMRSPHPLRAAWLQMHSRSCSSSEQSSAAIDFGLVGFFGADTVRSPE